MTEETVGFRGLSYIHYKMVLRLVVLDETNILRALTECLTTHVYVVLSYDALLITANPTTATTLRSIHWLWVGIQ